jgi:hypothetical protein
VDDCTDESVMEFLESTQERDASVTAEFVKAEVLAKVTFAMSEKDPALRVMKAVADYYSLHRNVRLNFINCKPKRAVEHLVSVIRPATLKALIESKLKMDKSELKKDFLEFVKYLEEMAIIHDEHCHVVEQKKTGGSGMKNNGKGNDAGSRSTRKRGMPTRRRQTLRLWATTERRLKTEMARPRISRQRISESRSRFWQTQALTTLLYRAVLWRTQGSVDSLSRSRCCRSPSC